MVHQTSSASNNVIVSNTDQVWGYHCCCHWGRWRHFRELSETNDRGEIKSNVSRTDELERTEN